MAQINLTQAQARLAVEDVANALPWSSLTEVVKNLGTVQVEMKVPDSLDGISKPVWAWLLTMEAARYGLMGLRDSYGEHVTFHPLPQGFTEALSRLVDGYYNPSAR